MDELHYIKIAQTLNTEYEEQLLNEKFHFRGNLNSFSLISLLEDYPEIGFSNLKTKVTGLKRFYEVIGKIGYKKRKLERGRNTPEKELQAWIILKALENDKKLFFNEKLVFLTSELALSLRDEQNNFTKRIVNDILALDSNGTLIVIELKSDRAKSRLEKQINDFRKVIIQNSNLFSSLVECLSNKKWNGKTKGIAIWPNSSISKKIDWAKDITEYTYEKESIIENDTIKFGFLFNKK